MSNHFFKPARLDMKTLSEYLSISRSSIYSLRDKTSDNYDETFPEPIRHGKKNLFITDEIDEWIKNNTQKLRKANG